MSGQYEAALEVSLSPVRLSHSCWLQDVSVILVQLNQPVNPTALLVQAGAFYAMGDFEHALVSFHRASMASNLLMKEKDEIMEGIKQSEEAIKNCLAVPENPFRNIEQATELFGQHFLTESLFELKSKLTKSRNESKPVTSKKSVFSEDIHYIEKFLLRMEELGGGSRLRSEATTALDYLADRKEFWGQHQPLRLEDK